MAKEDTLACKECKRTCCDDQQINLREGQKDIDPNKLKAGDWLTTHGIIWVKKRNGKWKCRAFDARRRLCRIWRYRPHLCRTFFCQWGKKRIQKLSANSQPEEEKRTYELLITRTSYDELKEGIKSR